MAVSTNLLNNLSVFFVLPLLTVCNLYIKPEQDIISRPSGSSIVITCSSTSVTSLKWLNVAGTEITDNYHDTRISLDVSSNSTKLVITNTRSSDTGHYTCIGNFSGLLLEKSLKLLIFKDITFDEVPSSQHMITNTISTIICKVSGEIKPNIYWKFNREKIIMGAKYIKVADGLKIVNVTERDAGLYTCSAEIDNAGLLEYRTINVTVHVPPRIIRGVGKNDAIQGEDFNFTCLADGYPTPLFEFFKIVDDEAIKVIEDGNRIFLRDNLLMLKPTLKDDEGYYKCAAKNVVGVNESAVGYFEVLVPAKVTKLNDIHVNEGAVATIVCEVEGNLPLEVSMGQSKDGHYNSVSKKSYERMKIGKVYETYHIRILNVEPEDAGIYFCKTSNSLAEDIKFAELHVQYSPRINVVKTLHLVHIWADISKNLTIYFTSSPQPHATWYLGTSELKSNDTFKMFVTTTSSSLEIFVKEIDQTWIFGEYKCTLYNFLGQVETYVELKRATIPSYPDVVLIESYATDVRLTLKPPKEDGGMPVIGYIVHNQAKTHEFTPDDEVRITDLKPNTFYIFTVKARNAVGAGIPYRIELNTKGISEPSLYLINNNWQQSKAFEHGILWRINSTGGMPILEYEVWYRKLTSSLITEDIFESVFPHTGNEIDKDLSNADGTWFTIMVKDSPKLPMNGLVIEDLEPKSFYVLRLRARNAIGWSAFTGPTTFVTAQASQSEHELRNSRGYSGLLSIIIFLFISFLLVTAAIIDIMCCYCCDKGLTKIIFLKCAKYFPFHIPKKQNSNPLDKQVQNNISGDSRTSKTHCMGKLKKKMKDTVCEEV